MSGSKRAAWRIVSSARGGCPCRTRRGLWMWTTGRVLCCCGGAAHGGEIPEALLLGQPPNAAACRLRGPAGTSESIVHSEAGNAGGTLLHRSSDQHCNRLLKPTANTPRPFMHEHRKRQKDANNASVPWRAQSHRCLAFMPCESSWPLSPRTVRRPMPIVTFPTSPASRHSPDGYGATGWCVELARELKSTGFGWGMDGDTGPLPRSLDS